MGNRRKRAYKHGRSRALAQLGLANSQQDNPVVSSFVDALPSAGGKQEPAPVSTVMNRMGGFGSPVVLTNSNLPANV